MQHSRQWPNESPTAFPQEHGQFIRGKKPKGIMLESKMLGAVVKCLDTEKDAWGEGRGLGYIAYTEYTAIAKRQVGRFSSIKG